MTIAIVEDPAALAALAPEWHALWRRSAASPFQSPAWLLPWWDAFGSGHLRVAVLHQAGTLTAVLPAYVLQNQKLLLLGAGTTDYLDALGQGAKPLLHALLRRAEADGVTRFDLTDIPPGSALHGLSPPPGWRATWSDGGACPVLTLPGIPAAIRRKLRMNRNRADREGGWTVETADAATLAQSLDALIALHQARWETDGEPGVLADPAVLAFHRAASPGLLAAGLLRLTLLRVGGAVAAATLALLSPGQIHFYLSGYDRARAFVSPGTLLLGAMLDQAQSEGRTEAHFLRGREPYKYAWGAKDRQNTQAHFTRNPTPPP